MINRQQCDRCHQPTLGTIMSVFNVERLCLDCKEAEKLHPEYAQAAAAHDAAVKNGDFLFRGTGLNFLSGRT